MNSHVSIDFGIQRELLSWVGRLMLDSASVFASFGDDVPLEYIQRIKAHEVYNDEKKHKASR